MCLGIHFTSQTCRHREFRVRKCSGPVPCHRALSIDEHRHIGECPPCLGGLFWPPQSYEQLPNMCTRLGPVGDRVATIQVYIEDLVNTWSLTALSELGRINHASPERGTPPSFTPHVMYRVLETIYREAYCLVCDRKDCFGRIEPCPHISSGQDITTHDASRIAGQATNTVAQFRVEVAREAWETNFSVKVEDDVDFQTWATSDILQRNQQQQQQLVWQRPNSTRKTVDHTWPLTAVAIADRYHSMQSKTRAFLDSLFRICQQTDRQLTGAGDGTYEWAVYMEVRRQMMDLATWVVANDPGVPEGQFDVVARALVKMVVHPTTSADTDIGGSWIWDQMPTLPNPDLTVYEAVTMAWVAGVREQAVDKMNALVVRATRRLREIRHWQTVNQNGKRRALVGARVDFHSVRVPSFALIQGPEEWKCMICWDGAGDGGAVIQLARCGHDLHHACMVRHVAGEGGGRGSNNGTRCPYCRQEFDGLPAGDEDVQGRLTGGMKVEPRPRNDFVMAGMTPGFVDAVDQWELSLGLWGEDGEGDVAVEVEDGEEDDETDDDETDDDETDDDEDDEEDIDDDAGERLRSFRHLWWWRVRLTMG
ncbi:hypothetical protein GE09DRAFT_310844 [Coniochaeta sp. 2T2.1]|nr:hypothetical protein GE09DRAFT_310844 [Coniochaeta sp. 2T2.1]